MKKHIFLIRHGQTIFNITGSILGISNPVLTVLGRQEVKNLAAHLKQIGVKPEVIYTSPLKRTFQTALILNQALGGKIKKTKLIREIDYGIYESKSNKILHEIEFGYRTQVMLGGNAETVDILEDKVKIFLEKLFKSNENNIFVVTHAFVASLITQFLMKLPRTFQNIQPLSTADYSHFRVEKGGENTVNVLSIQRNCLKGALSI